MEMVSCRQMQKMHNPNSDRPVTNFSDKDTDTIGLYIRNVYKEGELSRKGTTEESSVVQNEGGRQVRRKVNYYNLD